MRQYYFPFEKEPIMLKDPQGIIHTHPSIPYPSGPAMFSHTN